MNKSTNSQHLEIAAGDYVATIGRTGAALIQLTYRAEKFCPERSAEAIVTSYHGSVIAPWPNRIRDGKYTFGSKEYSLPINEPARANALHGFSANKSWRLDEKTENSASLILELGSTEGYPWPVNLRAHYVIGKDGLELSFSATGSKNQPFGWAFHPYLTLPGAEPETWTLSHSANSVMLVDNERLLPVSLAEVGSTNLDFRTGTSPEIQGLDHAFTDLKFDNQGFTLLRLESDQHLLMMNFDSRSPWLQLHYPNPELTSVPTVVVEPMSLEPDAFNSRCERDVALNGSFDTTVRIQITQK